MEAYVKHFNDGVEAAKLQPNPPNPYTGPRYAGAKGQKKAAAFARGVASVHKLSPATKKPK